MSEAKQTYDKAAEVFCDHVAGCSGCTMTGPHCEIGNDLLRAENEAWNVYRRPTDSGHGDGGKGAP